MVNAISFDFQGKSYLVEANPPKPVFKQVTDYLNKGSGVFRIQKLAGDVFKAVSVAFSSSVAEGYSKDFTRSWSMLAIPRIPEVAGRFVDVFFGKKPDDANGASEQCKALSLDLSAREVERRVNELSDCVFTAICAARVFCKQAILGRIADVFALVGVSSECSMAVEDLVNAERLMRDEAPSAVREAARATRNHAVARVVKAVLGVFSAIAAVASIVLGGGLSLGLALTSSVLALFVHFYEQNASYKVVDFAKYCPPALPAPPACPALTLVVSPSDVSSEGSELINHVNVASQANEEISPL